MIYEVKLTEKSKIDFQQLDNSQKQQILKSFMKIELHGMQTGQQLRGKLKDCRKLKHKRLGLRVIFRESNFGIEIIEIIAIGRRSDNEVYTIAEKRLGR
ncbi:addiction module toxin RelE [Candidatus Enterococcus mangumiae]|uniref:Addiction module toxin RelE n=1 Tax=Candidatus Enterococcus mangumiae TaxID=2230878 RepID=A0ABZ2SXA5_9ENTE|nr:addiction module toxin RelE [Enterococcus sp. DIV1094]MBO0489206.1 addiction module toxin RelE [Enterococcus sp. DIV1094]